MSEMKYIVVQDVEGEEFPIIFAREIFHSQIMCDGHKIVSAGFCTLGNPVKAYGYSESLGIESRPEDAKLISKNV